MAGVTRDDSTQGEGDGCCIEAFGPFIFTGKVLLDGRFPSLPTWSVPSAQYTWWGLESGGSFSGRSVVLCSRWALQLLD